MNAIGCLQGGLVLLCNGMRSALCGCKSAQISRVYVLFSQMRTPDRRTGVQACTPVLLSGVRKNKK